MNKLEFKIKPFCSNYAFTLVELLVVFSIIVILVAICIPQYLRYVSTAKSKACASNFDIATVFIVSELKKKPTRRSTDIIIELNRGGKKDPYNSANNAFFNGVATGIAGDCSIGVVLSGGGVSMASAQIGSTVDISGVDGGDASTNYTILHYNADVE